MLVKEASKFSGNDTDPCIGSRKASLKRSKGNDAVAKPVNYYSEVKKTDKQTQITTLLYTKFKLERNFSTSSLSSLAASEKPISVASVKPNAAHLVESVDIVAADEEKSPKKVEPIVKEAEPQLIITDANDDLTTTTTITLRNNRPPPAVVIDDTSLKCVEKADHTPTIVVSTESVVSPSNVAPSDASSTITLRRNRFSANTTGQPVAAAPVTPPLAFQSRATTSRFK